MAQASGRARARAKAHHDARVCSHSQDPLMQNEPEECVE